jgi:DNA adenine methylase
MKPPFSYYGGKQRMCHNILPLFPEHKIYVEPFSGAGTLLFAQKPHGKTEVLNDINSLIYNFFKVLKEHRLELIGRLECCPYSQELHKEAKRICKECTASDMELAEAFFVNIMQSFGNIISDSWVINKFLESSNNRKYNNKIERLKACSLRLRNAYISNEDAIKCIKRWDDKDAFFYCDPPYIDTDCGHYKGYTYDQYRELISTLENIKGKALVSGYENDIVPKTWKRHKFLARSSVYNTKSKKYDLRIEVVFEKP